MVHDPKTAGAVRIPHPSARTSQREGLCQSTRRVATDDPSEARFLTEQLLACSHSFTATGQGRDEPFEASVELSTLTKSAVMTSRYGTAVEIGCRPQMPYVTLSIVRHGSITFVDERGALLTCAVPGTAAIVAYDQAVRMQWTAGTEQVMLLVNRHAVEDRLERMLGDRLDEPLAFRPEIDLSRDGGFIQSIFDNMSRLVAAGAGCGDRSILVDEFERSIATSMLVTLPHSHSDQLFIDRRSVPPRMVRRVLDLIESNPVDALRMSDLAKFAGTSERSLYQAFGRHVGISPMAYLRRRRLQLAHDELQAAEPAGSVSVTDVAYRWGFNHTGRFANDYKRLFGESPSATLRG